MRIEQDAPEIALFLVTFVPLAVLATLIGRAWGRGGCLVMIAGGALGCAIQVLARSIFDGTSPLDELLLRTSVRGSMKLGMAAGVLIGGAIALAAIAWKSARSGRP